MPIIGEPPTPGSPGRGNLRSGAGLQSAGRPTRQRRPLVGKQTEQIILAATRIGQHVFALNVLSNCGQRCVFCGLNPSAFGARRMLVAGHIKPWKDSEPSERLDPRNGLPACPSHDVAFDTGLLTVGPALQIHVSEALAKAVRGDPMTRQYYGRPPLLEHLLLPDDAQLPARRYLDWHKTNVFIA